MNLKRTAEGVVQGYIVLVEVHHTLESLVIYYDGENTGGGLQEVYRRRIGGGV